MRKVGRYQAGTNFARAVGEVLRRTRCERGLTQRQLASPYSGAFLSSVEHGQIVPSLPALATLVAGLQLSMHEFFELVEGLARDFGTDTSGNQDSGTGTHGS